MSDTPADRLTAARINKGFRSMASAARAFGWTNQTYKAHESGLRSFHKEADRYARAYGVSAGWLMYGENPPDWFKNKEFNRDTIESGRAQYIKVPVVDGKQLFELSQNTLTLEHVMRNERYSFIHPITSSEFSGHFVALDVLKGDEKNSPILNPGDNVTIDLDLIPKPGKLAVAIVNKAYIIGRFVERNAGHFLSFENKSAYPDDKPLNEFAKIYRVVAKTISE